MRSMTIKREYTLNNNLERCNMKAQRGQNDLPPGMVALKSVLVNISWFEMKLGNSGVFLLGQKVKS